MGERDDIDAEFRRLTAGLGPTADRGSTGKPSRASLREVKREARRRREAAARAAKPVKAPKPPKPGRAAKSATKAGPELPRAFMYGPADQITPAVAQPKTRSRTFGVIAAAAIVFLGALVYQNRLDAPALSPTGPSATHGGTDTGVGRPPVGVGEADAPLRPAPAVNDEPGRYAFMATQTGSTSPVAYDPCRAIHYVVRTTHEPKQGPALIAHALAAVSRATGLQFVDDGRTKEIPSSERPPFQPSVYGERWAPVLIGWVTAKENPDVAQPIVGRGGSYAIGVPGGPIVYVTGGVALSSEWYATVLATRHGRAEAEAVLLHELGHLVGLGHVADKSQIMFERERPQVISYGVGDLAGLAKLGGGACEPRL